MKQCTCCKHFKVSQNFAKSSSIFSGRRSICKGCATEKQRAYAKKNPESIRRTKRWQHLREYGLTPETYNEILIKQNNVCALCSKGQKEKARLCVDHDHRTGQVRGLLCRHCNAILGIIEKTGFSVKRITAYLEYNLSTKTHR